jgi:hypothetical protein
MSTKLSKEFERHVYGQWKRLIESEFEGSVMRVFSGRFDGLVCEAKPASFSLDADARKIRIEYKGIGLADCENPRSAVINRGEEQIVVIPDPLKKSVASDKEIWFPVIFDCG